MTPGPLWGLGFYCDISVHVLGNEILKNKIEVPVSQGINFSCLILPKLFLQVHWMRSSSKKGNKLLPSIGLIKITKIFIQQVLKFTFKEERTVSEGMPHTFPKLTS